MQLKLPMRWLALTTLVLFTSASFAQPPSQPLPKGERVFTCGHSFHAWFIAPILKDMAEGAGIKGHEIVGVSKIGGSRAIQHWDVPEDKNQAKAALRAGKVDVLTLSCMLQPDEGIEKFAELGFKHNPNIRVTLQEFWIPFDKFEWPFKGNPNAVDFNAATGDSLRKIHDPYFKDMDDYVVKLNAKLGKQVVFVAPVGQAILDLRERIIAGKVPGIAKQDDLFTDKLGHPQHSLEALVSYVHFGVIYRRSPVGLPLPEVLAKAKKPQWDDKLNRLLQEIAWEAVTRHPLSGVKAAAAPAFEGEKSTWHGFDRYDFVMDNETFAIKPFKAPANEKDGVGAPSKGQRRCIVVAPKTAAAGNPWSWRGCYWNHEPQAEVELLRRGFHIAFITPDPGKQWDAWYAHLTEKHGFAKKPAFIGMSKGGDNAYIWGTANPDKVSCIYGDNPAIRQDCLAKLSDLAKNEVSLLNICGSFDFLLERHTLAIENRYQQLGGRTTVVIKDGTAHHPHSLRNPKIIADWIVDHMLLSASPRPAFADDTFTKTYYYSLENTYSPLKEENTYATCRGPGFTECYERYDVRTKSQWGITGMAVLVPKTAAPGKPWVLRADPIRRDAVVDQALLAKGYHIVTPPLTAQSGPVREQWDATYKHLISHGFAKKPVLEGTGPAVGEAYAWAIDNPDKVSCLYGENPILRSLMSKKPPLENLTPLAKAGIPVLHVCGSLDPWLQSQTRLAEKRYQELGGQITVIVKEGVGHVSLDAKDRGPVVDFIMSKDK